MSERELIETALSVPRQMRLSVDTEVIEDAARQYLASLDAPAPSDDFRQKLLREPRQLSDDDIAELDRAMFSSMEHLYDADDPSPVPQEGVSEGEIHASAMRAYWEKTGIYASAAGLQAALAPLLETNARLKARIEHWEKTADHHWSARQKLQRELNVVTELYNAGRGAEARVKELEEGWHLCHAEGKLTDPIAVHINMLRGTIAKPSVKNIIHLYGREALLKELCEDAQTKTPSPSR